MEREYINFNKNDRFEIEITTMSEYMSSISIIYDGVRHFFCDCFSKIYRDLGYDEVVYNENGIVLIKKRGDELIYFCGFDAIENKYIYDCYLCESFYEDNIKRSDGQTLSRRF